MAPAEIEWRHSDRPVGYDEAVAAMERRIAAIGVRVRHWVSYHGVALNVAPDLDHYRGIVPCGIARESSGHGVTSLARLGVPVSMPEIDRALRATFDAVFGNSAPCRGARDRA